MHVTKEQVGGIASCSRMSTVRQVDVGKWKIVPYIYPATMHILYSRSPISGDRDRYRLSDPMAIVRALTIREIHDLFYAMNYHCALNPNIRLQKITISI